MTRTPRRLAACLLALPLALVAACGADQPTPTTEQTPAAPVQVKGTVVSTAVSSNEAQIAVPEPVTASWTALGQKGSGLEWVSVAGDGTDKTTDVDLATDPAAGATTVPEKINADAAQTDGRSVLAGLDAIDSPAKSPVWVFSPLLDTEAPVDFRELAFDESPASVVKAIKKAGDLPDLKGRRGDLRGHAGRRRAGQAVQAPGRLPAGGLGGPRQGGRREEGDLLRRHRHRRRTPARSRPSRSPIPTTTSPPPTQGTTRTCTLPSPALFVADQPTLIDKKATLKALKKCIGDSTPAPRSPSRVTRPDRAGTNNDFAKTLSTQRATEVAALLKELDVPAKNIVEVVGYGSSKPLVKPDTDPKNRAVVVTFSTTE